jgi:hypothetical protein
VLEQAGISWPIRNALFLPGIQNVNYTSPDSIETISRSTNAFSNAYDIHMQSPLSRASTSSLLQRRISHPPPLSHYPKPPLGSRGHRGADMCDNSFDSFRDNSKIAGSESWSTVRSTSNSTGDLFMDDCMFASSQSLKPLKPWKKPPSRHQQSSRLGEGRQNQDGQVVMTLHDDQFGQILEALSPPKRYQDLPPQGSNATNAGEGHRPAGHTYHPPKMGSLPDPGRPSAAALARKNSYSDLPTALRTMPHKPSPDKLNTASIYHPSMSSNKENFPSSQSRLPTPFPCANRVATPNSPGSMRPRWDSDVSMRDPSSLFSQYNGERPLILSEIQNKQSAAHPPSTIGGTRSRKEGLAHHNSLRLLETGSRHDQSLLPPTNSKHSLKPTPRDPFISAKSTPNILPNPIEIIDVDAIDPQLDSTTPPFHNAKHKQGMSSVDSTAQIEQTLYSVLGPEYSTFESGANASDVENQLAHSLRETTPVNTPLNPNANASEPARKRKRGLARDESGSPLGKRERSGVDDEGVKKVLDGEDEDML